MNITKSIDDRIQDLQLKRKEYLNKSDTLTANQMWSRIEELKGLKSKFTDKQDNWII